MIEEWRAVKGFEGRYEVSSMGAVRSLPNNTRKGVRIMKTTPGHQGYRQINLFKDGERHMSKVHLLVATAFHGERPPGLVCRHLDGDNTNNQSINLMWGTHLENAQDKVDHGSHRGERNSGAKLTEAQVKDIRARLALGAVGRALAGEFGVSATVISNIKKGRSWSHI